MELARTVCIRSWSRDASAGRCGGSKATAGMRRDAGVQAEAPRSGGWSGSDAALTQVSTCGFCVGHDAACAGRAARSRGVNAVLSDTIRLRVYTDFQSEYP